MDEVPGDPGGVAAAPPKPRAVVVAEPLNVAPALVGLALASPTRRAVAMAIDLAAIGLVSGAGTVWLGVGLLLVVLQLRNPGTAPRRGRRAVGWAFVALCVVLGAVDAWKDRERPPRRRPHDFAVAARERAASAAAHDGAASAAGRSDAEHIAWLERALVEARKPKPLTLKEELDRVSESVGASFGWAIVYFSLLPALWPGQTLGKRLLRLRVVELTGKPMTVMRNLKRYGGYAAGLATGGVGFLQLLWEPNRQALEDRAAHTVVLDVRAQRRLSRPAGGE